MFHVGIVQTKWHKTYHCPKQTQTGTLTLCVMCWAGNGWEGHGIALRLATIAAGISQNVCTQGVWGEWEAVGGPIFEATQGQAYRAVLDNALKLERNKQKSWLKLNSVPTTISRSTETTSILGK